MLKIVRELNDMESFLSIGQIVNIHGVRGEVKVYPLTDDLERFKRLKEVYIEKKTGLQSYKVLSAKQLKNTVVLKLEGVDTVEEAQRLRELYLKIERSNAVKLPKNSYFICDLIGLKVFDIENNLLGSLQDVIQTGSNDVYIVKPDKGKDILIPAIKSVVKSIDLGEQKIIVELPEGLI